MAVARRKFFPQPGGAQGMQPPTAPPDTATNNPYLPPPTPGPRGGGVNPLAGGGDPNPVATAGMPSPPVGAPQVQAPMPGSIGPAAPGGGVNPLLGGNVPGMGTMPQRRGLGGQPAAPSLGSPMPANTLLSLMRLLGRA